MKRVIFLVLSVAIICSIIGCGATEPLPEPTPGITDFPEPTETPEPTATPVPLTVSGLLQAFRDAGLPIINETAYAADTDQNGLLGRPGEYTEKVNFDDRRFFGEWDDPDDPSISIEYFANSSDMNSRKEYVQSVMDTVNLPGLKYYMYDTDVFLLRVPYDVSPEVAEEYERVFAVYMSRGKVPVLYTPAPATPAPIILSLDSLGEYIDVSPTALKPRYSSVDLKVTVKNKTDKAIKYIYLTFSVFNAVDDEVYCEIYAIKANEMKIVGPLEPNKKGTYRSNGHWFNSEISYCRLIGCRIEYMDGTSDVFQ